MNIKNITLYKNHLSIGIVLALAILIFLFYFDPALAGLYKCKDQNDKVTYRDRPCSKNTRQKLHIHVPPIDEASSERLKKYQTKDTPPPKTKNQIIIIDKHKPSQECVRYSKELRQMKQQLNTGYTQAQGDSIQQSIDSLTKTYKNSCK